MQQGGPYYIRFEPPSNAGRRRRFFRNHFQVDMPARNGFRKSRSGKELATISWHHCVIVLLQYLSDEA